MSMDDNSEDQGQSEIAGFVPERQEMPDKEQTLQPMSTMFSGKSTGETVGSSQSGSLAAGNARKRVKNEMYTLLSFITKNCCNYLIKKKIKAALSNCRTCMHIMDLKQLTVQIL